MNIGRREFLKSALTLLCSIASLAWLRPSTGKREKKEKWYAVGNLSEFASGKPVLVQRGRDLETGELVHLRSCFVIRLEGGESVRVLSATCTHAGCDVAPEEAGGFSCPCHGARYDADGKVLKGPARAPLAILPSKVENGEVQVLIAD